MCADQRERRLGSAIVSTYNAEQLIRGRIEDLEAQTIADRLEIIVVDSGSEQDEQSVVNDLRGRYATIVYVQAHERETIYGAWNRGLRIARGPYVTNANGDHRLRRDALEHMVNALDERPDIALVYADSAITEPPDFSFDEAPIRVASAIARSLWRVRRIV